MSPYVPYALLAFALSLMSLLLVPKYSCNRHFKVIRNMVCWLAALQCLSATVAIIVFLATSLGQSIHLRMLEIGIAEVSVHYDGVAALMLALVSFVGLVVCRYSIRYLDGDPSQGNYFRWVSFTIGAVSLLVLSGNLLMFFCSWVATSFGLHHLLLHYPNLPGAQRAAWTKFTISRIGDALLVGALVLIYQEFGTFDFKSLFASVGDSAQLVGSRGTTLSWISCLLVLGAVTKSAQLPFHGWLPETMETPTPVSALMHAGVVNAGGYLVIRLSPLVAITPSAMGMLAMIGATTAAFAGLVMLTQSSIKKKLAYSTIAQMGFMMLQCGLGAFSAAMLHIIAHSLYKAHAFLGSGNVLHEARATDTNWEPDDAKQLRPASLLVVAGIVVATFGMAAWLIGKSPTDHAGGYALAAVLCMALTLGLWESIATWGSRIRIAALTALVAFVGLYVGAYVAIDNVVATDVATPIVGAVSIISSCLVVVIFAGLCSWQVLLRSNRELPWLEVAYVHCLNGFYLDVALRRAFGHLSIRQ